MEVIYGVYNVMVNAIDVIFPVQELFPLTAFLTTSLSNMTWKYKWLHDDIERQFFTT